MENYFKESFELYVPGPTYSGVEPITFFTWFSKRDPKEIFGEALKFNALSDSV